MVTCYMLVQYLKSRVDDLLGIGWVYPQQKQPQIAIFSLGSTGKDVRFNYDDLIMFSLGQMRDNAYLSGVTYTRPHKRGTTSAVSWVEYTSCILTFIGSRGRTWSLPFAELFIID